MLFQSFGSYFYVCWIRIMLQSLFLRLTFVMPGFEYECDICGLLFKRIWFLVTGLKVSIILFLKIVSAKKYQIKYWFCFTRQKVEPSLFNKGLPNQKVKPLLFNERQKNEKMKPLSFNEGLSNQKVKPSSFNEGLPNQKGSHYHLMKGRPIKK